MKHAIAIDNLARSNRHLKEIRTNLRRIAVFYEPALDGKCSDDENDRRSPNAAGEPGPVEAISARTDAYTDLHFWCRFILDQVNEGTIRTIVRPEIRDMVAFIERWSTALIDQWPEDSDNLRKDAYRHGEKLENLARGWSVKRIEIGPCPRFKEGPETESDMQLRCTGQLWAILQTADTLLPKQILCDQEAQHRWSPHSWRDLGKQLDASLIRRLQPSQQAATNEQSGSGSQAAG